MARSGETNSCHRAQDLPSVPVIDLYRTMDLMFDGVTFAGPVSAGDLVVQP
jgi:hypothetical protein